MNNITTTGIMLALLLATPVLAQQRPAPAAPTPAAPAADPHKAGARIAGHTGIPRPKTTGTTTITFGLNGHDGRTYYPLAEIEQRMQWMQQNKLTNWRTDVGTSSTDILDKLVPLAKKYGVTVRPMLYPGSTQATYEIVKRYKDDIKVWEIGNEQDAPVAGAQDRINAMMQSVRGVEQAEAELHMGFKTTINIMSCNNEAGSAAASAKARLTATCGSSTWLRRRGWNFNYVSFHYYPRIHEPGFWMDKYLRPVTRGVEEVRRAGIL